MKLSFRTALWGAGLSLLAPVAGAGSPETWAEYGGHYVLDVSTGTLTLLAPEEVDERQRLVTVCHSNTTEPGVVGLFFGIPAGDEYVDWGVKACAQTSLVSELNLRYGTTALDISQAGPGAAFTVAVYTGTTGFCDLGTEVFRMSFSGLPGSQTGNGTAFDFTVTGIEPFCLVDGEYGLGFFGDDGLTGPSAVVTTGVCGASTDPNTGTTDCLDEYSPGPATLGNCVDTTTFLPAGTTSFYVEFAEIDVTTQAASSVTWNPAANPETATTTSLPVIGADWEVEVTPVLETRAVLVISANQTVHGGTGNLCGPGALTGLFEDGTSRYVRPFFLRPHLMSPNDPGDPYVFSVPVPKEEELIGQEFCTQVFGLNFMPLRRYAKNALRIQVGTQ